MYLGCLLVLVYVYLYFDLFVHTLYLTRLISVGGCSYILVAALITLSCTLLHISTCSIFIFAFVYACLHLLARLYHMRWDSGGFFLFFVLCFPCLCIFFMPYLILYIDLLFTCSTYYLQALLFYFYFIWHKPGLLCFVYLFLFVYAVFYFSFVLLCIFIYNFVHCFTI
jgi:hypothetical protein